jgi:hypothetical protein
MIPIARNAILAATLMFLLGCASKPALLMPDDRLSLSSQPQIIAIHYPPGEDFRFSYGGGFMGGGAFVVLSEASNTARLKSELWLEDPVPHFKERLVGALQANLKLTNVRTLSELPQNIQEARRTGTPALDDALKEAFRTGVVLDVQTRRWMVEGTRVVYLARARLLRLSDLHVIWRGACKHVSELRFPETRKPDPLEPPPGAKEKMEALEADDGKVLKATLREAAGGCADSLAGEALGKVGQPDR